MFLSAQGQENPGSPGVDGQTEVGCRLRGYEIWLLVYHKPEEVTKREQILNILYGHSLRGDEEQLVIQVPKKWNHVGWSPCWDHCKNTLVKTLRGSWQSRAQGLDLVDHPIWQEPQELSQFLMTRYLENTHHTGWWKLRNPPLGRTEAQRLWSPSGTEFAKQTCTGERGRSRDASTLSPFPPGKDDWRSQNPDWVRFPRCSWTTSARSPGTKPVTEEILPKTLEIISGCEWGEEERSWKGCGIRLQDGQHPGLCSKNYASATKGTDRQPLHLQQRRNPVRRTSSRHPYVCHWKSQSHRRLLKRAPYLCIPAWSGGRRHLLLRPRHRGGGAATVSRGNGREPSHDQPRRRLSWNFRWKQGPENKSAGQSCSHLVQGRVEQRRREKTRRRGKVSIL